MTIKMSKRIFSVLMAAVIMAGCVLPAFAATKTCDCGKNPILVVSGFSQYDFVDTNTGKKVWVPETGILVDAITKAVQPLATLLASDRTKKDYDTFCDEFFPLVNGVLHDVAVNPDGTPVNDYVELVDQFTGPVSKYDYAHVREVFNNEIVDAVCEAVGTDHVWLYGLDWRVDPMELADEINEYVQRIKKTSGHDKVSICGISMGGIVMSCYLTKYGYDDISNITMMSSAFTGIEMVGALFNGRINIDEMGLYQIINDSVGDEGVSNALESTGLLSRLLPIVDDLLKYEKDRLYREVFVPNFGYNAGMWSFVPQDLFDSAEKQMIQYMDSASKAELTAFKQRIEAYHNDVQANIGDLLKQAQADGVCVAVVSCYNMQMPPVSEASKFTGDQVIETMHSSGYATVALQGKTLKVDATKPYVSPDKMIDASTCYLPDNTWFIKNEQHVGFSNAGKKDNGEFYKWILTAPADTDINSNPKYPQFMSYDAKAKELVPMNLLGDVDGNGLLSITDAKLILRHIVGSTTLTAEQLAAADMNSDTEVTVVDAKLLLKAIAERV